MTKSRIFLAVLLYFIAGVVAGSFFVIPIGPLFVGAIGAVAWLGVGIIEKKRGLWVSALFLLAFLCGTIRFAYADRMVQDFTALYGMPLAMRGIIVEEPERTGLGQRIVVGITSLDGDDIETSFRARATLRPYPAYQIGDELKIKGALEEPRRQDGFDEESYLKRRGISATMFYPKIERVGEERGNRLLLILSKIKHAFEDNIDAILPEPHAAFLKGLLLGERASLPQELIGQFRATGTSHIVALSGYNITLIGNAIQRGLLFLTVPFASSFWLASSAIILFVIMTGASASVVRAGIMGVLLLIAQKEGRGYRMAPALVFAAAAMVFQNPYVLRFDAGFQLSFAATLGLIYLSPRVGRWIDDFSRLVRRDRTSRAVRQHNGAETESLSKRILIETLAAQIAVFPLLIFLFGRVSVISPIVNVLVLLAVPYAMGIGFIAAMLAFVSDALGRIVGAAAWVLLEYQLRMIRLFAHIPFAGAALGTGAFVAVILLYLFIGWRIWRKSRKT